MCSLENGEIKLTAPQRSQKYFRDNQRELSTYVIYIYDKNNVLT